MNVTVYGVFEDVKYLLLSNKYHTFGTERVLWMVI